MSITIPYRELHRLVTVAAKSASTDKFIPVLAQVRLRARDGVVEAVATDRYTVTWVLGESSFKGEPFGLSVANWRHLLGLYRPAIRSDVTLHLEVAEDRLTVNRGEGLLYGPADVSARYPLVDGAFPKIDHLRRLPVADARSSEPLPLNPKLLAHLPHDEAAIFIPGLPGKVSWVVGVDYMLALMGLRNPAVSTTEWLDRWAETEATAGDGDGLRVGMVAALAASRQAVSA